MDWEYYKQTESIESTSDTAAVRSAAATLVGIGSAIGTAALIHAAKPQRWLLTGAIALGTGLVTAVSSAALLSDAERHGKQAAINHFEAQGHTFSSTETTRRAAESSSTLAP